MPVAQSDSVVFGPVPSRRLGRSLGINNLRGKTCSYSCAYCQLGRTTSLRASRRAFVAPEVVERSVGERLEAQTSRVDALTFVPTGEPTLDARLGESIRRLKRFGVRVAVVTNASLLWRPDVQDDLAAADWVSLKVDSVQEATWRSLNRPVRTLRLDRVLDGIAAFARRFSGTLTTETMLVGGLNDRDDDVREIAEFLRTVRPTPAYLMVPVRPPAEAWVRPTPGRVLARVQDIMAQASVPVCCLVEDTDGDFSSPGEAAAALLATAAVHPLHREAVESLLSGSGTDWSIVERLIKRGELSQMLYRGRVFYRTVGAPRARRSGTRRRRANQEQGGGP